MKFKALAILAAAAFAATPVFAGDKACCAHQAANSAKMDCTNFANLNLTAEQKTKMDSLAEECHKAGCTEQSMAQMEKGAAAVLSKEQFATWKATSHGKPAGKQS